MELCRLQVRLSITGRAGSHKRTELLSWEREIFTVQGFILPGQVQSLLSLPLTQSSFGHNSNEMQAQYRRDHANGGLPPQARARTAAVIPVTAATPHSERLHKRARSLPDAKGQHLHRTPE